MTVPASTDISWRGENTHHAALNFYPNFIPLFADRETAMGKKTCASVVRSN